MSATGAQHDMSPTPRYSSSPDLSSPPASDTESVHQQLSNEHRDAQSTSIIVAHVPKKRGRKPKEKDPNAAGSEPPKIKRTRKPRDPNAPIKTRKKKDAAPGDANANAIRIPSAPARLTEVPAATSPYADPPRLSPDAIASASAAASQRGKNEAIRETTQKPINSFFAAAPPPPQPQPQPQPQTQPQPQPQQQPQQQTQSRTSGQNYDPIRSNYDPVRETGQNSYQAQMSPKPAQLLNRASASPSISSLVDPPNQSSTTSPSMATQSFFKLQNDRSVPSSPTIYRAQFPMTDSSSLLNQPVAGFVQDRRVESVQVPQQAATPLTVTATVAAIATPTLAPVALPKTAPASKAPSPKPSKVVDATPPPLPGANGVFGGIGGPKDGTDSRAPTIVLHIPMNGETNKYVNFTRMAEERYGWDALHPRLAAQRERLARVAAAGAALEKNGSHKESGDEMSLDMSDGEGSNVEMGGMSDGRTGTDGGAKKIVRKRKTKEDDYDKDDGFVDDSEMLWEEQAAASKDGFFVYSGPLIPEGEKPTLERSEGAPKRGRGSRGGRVSGTTRALANTRGGGAAGSTGVARGQTVRKPRVTKADRARMELEKADREQLGIMLAKPYHAVLASAPVLRGEIPLGSLPGHHTLLSER